MTKSEYLDMRGFNEKDYALMTKDELGNLSDKPGAINNMYAANDPKGKTFGPGAYVVKRSWAEENMETDGPASTPTPPPPTPNPVAEKQETEISKFLSIRIANLVKKGWEDQPEIKALTLKNETIPYSELEELDNSDYTKLIISLDHKEEETKTVEKEVVQFLCLNNKQSGQERCKEQCGYCEMQDKIKETPVETPKEEPVEEKPKENILDSRIKSFLEICTTWKRKDDILTNGGLKIELSDLDKMDKEEFKRFLNNCVLQEEKLLEEEQVEKEVVEEVKQEPKIAPREEPVKEEPKPKATKEAPDKRPEKVKQEPIKVPKAEPEAIDSFKEFERLANIFKEAKKSIFIVSQIKELLDSKDADSNSGLSDGEILDKIYQILD